MVVDSRVEFISYFLQRQKKEQQPHLLQLFDNLLLIDVDDDDTYLWSLRQSPKGALRPL